LGGDLDGVGVGEDRLDRRGDRWGVLGGHGGVQVAHEMHPAALPRRTCELLGHSRFQTGMGIGDDQMHPGQAAGAQQGQELAPEILTTTSPKIQLLVSSCLPVSHCTQMP